YSPDLAQHCFRVIDVLEHVEDPDKIELAGGERRSFRGRDPEIDFFRPGAGRGDRAPAHVTAVDLEVRSGTLDSLCYLARPATDVEHAAAHGSEVLQQVAQLQPVHVPRLWAHRGGAPALGLVVERGRGR